MSAPLPRIFEAEHVDRTHALDRAVHNEPAAREVYAFCRHGPTDTRSDLLKIEPQLRSAGRPSRPRSRSLLFPCHVHCHERPLDPVRLCAPGDGERSQRSPPARETLHASTPSLMAGSVLACARQAASRAWARHSHSGPADGWRRSRADSRPLQGRLSLPPLRPGWRSTCAGKASIIELEHPIDYVRPGGLSTQHRGTASTPTPNGA